MREPIEGLKIPSRLATRIQKEAKVEGVTVSELLTQLLRERKRPGARSGVRRRTAQSRAAITRRLNKVYATQDSSLDPVVVKLQLRAIGPEAW